MERYGEKEDRFPLGFRFKPKDEELVKYYLLPRLQGRPTVPNDSVVEADVYACHPETLASEHKSGGLLVAEISHLDEYVMCKIYVCPQHKRKGDADEEEGTNSACSSTQHIQGTPDPKLSEKQAGKRPMLEQPQRGLAPPARKQARQGSLRIRSKQASWSTSNAAAPTQVYYGAPGQPTGAHYGLQAPPMQRPAGACNVQAPAGAYSGQRLVQMPTPTPVIYQPFADATDDPFGQMATMTARPPNPANQAAPTRLPCFPGNPPRRHPVTAFRPQVSLQCCYDQNYRAVQPPGNASSSRLRSLAAYLPLQQTQQPFFNGDVSRRGGAAAAPPGPPYNGYPYQRSSLMPAADGHGGAANERSGAARLNVNAEQYFVDLATINPSLPGARPQPAPAPASLVESPAPAAVGVAKIKAETGEKSGLNTPDAA